MANFCYLYLFSDGLEAIQPDQSGAVHHDQDSMGQSCIRNAPENLGEKADIT